MKTKLRILQGLLVVVLLFSGAMNAVAQTSQTTTQTVCVGNQPYLVTASALPSPTYTWEILGGTSGIDWQINGTSNSITVDWNIPGDYVLSVYTTSNGCPGPAQTVAVHVNPILPVSVVISTVDPTTVCEGVTVNFLATITNGGSNPTYQWYNNGTLITGETAATYAYVGVAPGADITCEVISDAPCAPSAPALSNSIPVTVTATLPLSLAISTTDPTTICENSTVTFTAVVTNGGSAPTYQWYDGATLLTGETSTTYVYTGVAPGTTITCQVVATSACITGSPVTSNGIAIIVNPTPATSPIFHN